MSTRIADEFLVDYAAGAAPAPVGLLVATHLALNPEARCAYRALEAAGGALLESVKPAAVSSDALARVLARTETAEREPAPAPRPEAAEKFLPRALAEYAPDGIERLPWRRIVSGVEEALLPVTGGRAKATMLRIAAGRAIPEHTHRGLEMTLVLDGAFADAAGLYARGDVCVADAAITHAPTAERARDCVCLIVSEAPIRLTGTFMRLLNPFLPR